MEGQVIRRSRRWASALKSTQTPSFVKIIFTHGPSLFLSVVGHKHPQASQTRVRSLSRSWEEFTCVHLYPVSDSTCPVLDNASIYKFQGLADVLQPRFASMPERRPGVERRRYFLRRLTWCHTGLCPESVIEVQVHSYLLDRTRSLSTWLELYPSTSLHYRQISATLTKTANLVSPETTKEIRKR